MFPIGSKPQDGVNQSPSSKSFSLKDITSDTDFHNFPLLEEKDFQGFTQDDIEKILHLAKESKSDTDEGMTFLQYLAKSLRSLKEKNPTFEPTAIVTALLSDPITRKVIEEALKSDGRVPEASSSTRAAARAYNQRAFGQNAHGQQVQGVTADQFDPPLTTEQLAGANQVFTQMKSAQEEMPPVVWNSAVAAAAAAMPHDDMSAGDIRLTSGKADPFKTSFGISFNLIAMMAFGNDGSSGLIAYYKNLLEEQVGSANINTNHYKNLSEILAALNAIDTSKDTDYANKVKFTMLLANGDTEVVSIANYCSRYKITLNNDSNVGSRRDADKSTISAKSTVAQSEMQKSTTDVSNTNTERQKTTSNLSDLISSVKELFSLAHRNIS